MEGQHPANKMHPKSYHIVYTVLKGPLSFIDTAVLNLLKDVYKNELN